MNAFELREPLFLLFALLAIPIFWASRAAKGRVTFSALGLLPEPGLSLRARLSFLPDALLAVAAVLFAVALAGPRLVSAEGRIEREGIAIMMVMDTSTSMLALDLSPEDQERTRLDIAKEDFIDFVVGEGEALEGRPDDAIGLITFARYPDSSSPITLDHGNLVRVAKQLETVPVGSEDDGTAIGDALVLALERLRQVDMASRVLVLLTDGRQNAGVNLPREVAEDAERLGVRIYTVGVGSDETKAPVRLCCDAFGQSYVRWTKVDLDEEMLQDVAETTGGRYFRTRDRAAMREVYEAIDALEKSAIEEERLVEYEELFEGFTLAALLTAIAAWFFSLTVFRRLP